MASEKATGLVIRTTDWSETSRIATIWTRESGKVRVLAKGGRRLKSNFEVALDLLSVCSIVLLRKAPGGLDLLTEARIDERFAALRADLGALYAAYYAAELLDIGTEERDPHPALYDAAIQTLRALGSDEETNAKVVAAFEICWLRELGYGPRLVECATCARDIDALGDVRLMFSPTAGGVVCPVCAANQRDRRPVSRNGLLTLRELCASVEAVTPRPGARAEVRGLLGHTVCHVLGKKPRLLGYLR